MCLSRDHSMLNGIKRRLTWPNASGHDVSPSNFRLLLLLLLLLLSLQLRFQNRKSISLCCSDKSAGGAKQENFGMSLAFLWTCYNNNMVKKGQRKIILGTKFLMIIHRILVFLAIMLILKLCRRKITLGTRLSQEETCLLVRVWYPGYRKITMKR